MKCVVTGAAGFIGSHLCERLLDLNYEVVGIDAFIPYYSPAAKQLNLDPARSRPEFRFHALDLRSDAIDYCLTQADVVFHLAAMPGLVRSWTDFDLYESCNFVATHRLLEAVRRQPSPPRIVFASTSSVYGATADGDEEQPTRPISPYGVTKLAAEHLCRAYSQSYGLSVVSLRYFSVYGPRQRPDMGYFKFIHALIHDEPLVVFGDGKQVRGNTFVGDCVDATIAAANAPSGETYNVGGGEAASVWDILKHLEALAGRSARVKQEPGRPGDQRHTLANTRKIESHLGWKAHTSLREGLARQWQWQSAQSNLTDRAPATGSFATKNR
jgi:nucleoside-diphosphate-sugar epimerase